MVRHQPAKTYENQFGIEVNVVKHRAGWHATFSAPKSVSLTALVGSDERVREAHRESVRVALGELERYTQARLGNVNAPQLTGKFATQPMRAFIHDSATRHNKLRHVPGTPVLISPQAIILRSPGVGPCGLLCLLLRAAVGESCRCWLVMARSSQCSLNRPPPSTFS